MATTRVDTKSRKAKRGCGRMKNKTILKTAKLNVDECRRVHPRLRQDLRTWTGTSASIEGRNAFAQRKTSSSVIFDSLPACFQVVTSSTSTSTALGNHSALPETRSLALRRRAGAKRATPRWFSAIAEHLSVEGAVHNLGVTIRHQGGPQVGPEFSGPTTTLPSTMDPGAGSYAP